MAITKFTGSTNTIQSLSDRPNQNEGLTPAQLKQKFDQFAIDNKAYINDVLTVDIENEITQTEAISENDLFNHKTSSDHDGRYYTEAEVQALLSAKTDKTGNHEGTWQGFSPAASEPGIQAVVNSHTSQLADISYSIKSFLCDDGQFVKGDGIHDDTTGIQNAINQSILNGYTIYLSKGDYVITDTLLFSYGVAIDWQLPKGFKFIGQNVSNTRIMIKMLNKPALKFLNINNGSMSSGVEVSNFSINSLVGYSQTCDGIVLLNCIGNIYKNIQINSCLNALLLSTKADTTILERNVGYTEQNIFDEIIISGCVNALTFRVGIGDPSVASYHGNIFKNCIFSINADVAVRPDGQPNPICTALNFESGFIYHCTFDIKIFIRGLNSYLMNINADGGQNKGQISYEVAGSYNPKIKTGDNVSAKFFFYGNMYGLGDLDWSEYFPISVGDLDYANSKTPITALHPSIGVEKFFALNLMPPVTTPIINIGGKLTKLMTLSNTISDLWTGGCNYLTRYKNTSGNLENGFIMACKELAGSGARFILGTIPETKNSIKDFVPGFEFRATGNYIKSVPVSTWLTFVAGKLQRNGVSTIYDTGTIIETFTANGSLLNPNGHCEKWGIVNVPTTGEQSFAISLTGLTECDQVLVTFETSGTTSGTNTICIKNRTSSGFTIYANTVVSGNISWRAYGKGTVS